MPVLVLKERRVEFDAGEFTSKEGIAIEKATGLSWQQFIETALPNNEKTNLTALTALVWMVRRRNGEPDLAYQDVEFLMGEVDWDLDDEQRAKVEKAMAEAAEAQGNPPVGAPVVPPRSGSGPGPSKPRGTSTGSRSRKSSGSVPATTTV